MRVRCCEQGCCVCGCRCIYSDRMPLLRASRHLSAVRSKVGSGSIDRRMTDLPAWLNSRQDTASFTKAERERERLRSGGSGYRARMSSKQASDRERERERESKIPLYNPHYPEQPRSITFPTQSSRHSSVTSSPSIRS